MEDQLNDKDNIFRALAIALATIGFFTQSTIIERIVLSLGCVMLVVHALAEVARF
jgi:hypothetical protein